MPVRNHKKPPPFRSDIPSLHNHCNHRNTGMVASVLANYNSSALVLQACKRDNVPFRICLKLGATAFVRSQIPPARIPGQWRENPEVILTASSGSQRQHLRPTTDADAGNAFGFALLAVRNPVDQPFR